MSATRWCCRIPPPGMPTIAFASIDPRRTRYGNQAGLYCIRHIRTRKRLQRTTFEKSPGNPMNDTTMNQTQAQQQALISMDSIKKVFFTDEVETHALAGVHFSIFPGEYVSISGPSGCGKSTLLSIL